MKTEAIDLVFFSSEYDQTLTSWILLACQYVRQKEGHVSLRILLDVYH